MVFTDSFFVLGLVCMYIGNTRRTSMCMGGSLHGDDCRQNGQYDVFHRSQYWSAADIH